MLKKKSSVQMVLSFDDKKKLTDYLTLLISIDIRLNKNKAKKKSTTKRKNYRDIGSLQCGPSFLLKIALSLG